MWLFWTPQTLTAQHTITLEPDESLHCAVALRLKPGTEVLVTNGQGACYTATLQTVSPKKCQLCLLQPFYLPPTPPMLHLAVAPLKHADRLEWLVEKATELGACSITLLKCHNNERNTVNLDRLQRIAVSAMKQSLRTTLPNIYPLTTIQQLLALPFNGQTLMAHCHNLGNKLPLAQLEFTAMPTRLLIGPEGDFSEQEVAHAQQLLPQLLPVTLGPFRLRTETAAIAALAFMNGSISKSV